MDLKNYKPQQIISNKHMLTLNDYTKDEILQIISLALRMKENKEKYRHVLEGKSLAMIFSKSSTRTRVSFEVGFFELGGHPVVLSSDQTQLGRGETVGDTAKVLSRMVDGIMIRTFEQEHLNILAKEGSIPVINGLTDDYHPCQVVADLMTIYENFGTFDNLKLTYMGDGNNMTHSLMIGCAKMGIDFFAACPKDYMPDPKIVEQAQEAAKSSGSKVVVTDDPAEAVKDADIIYADVWCSMGQDAKNNDIFMPYQINKAAFSKAKEKAIFLHCLPAHRGEEVTADIIDGPCSRVFDEAENRLHAQKAIMALLMGDKTKIYDI